MTDDGRLVTVDINGLRYPIRSNLDPAYVADLASYVERKMQLASRESPAGDTLKIAVLAALNIADEYFRAREDGTSQRTGLAEAEGTGGELTVLRTEREQIRTRVDDMLRQIEALNL